MNDLSVMLIPRPGQRILPVLATLLEDLRLFSGVDGTRVVEKWGWQVSIVGGTAKVGL